MKAFSDRILKWTCGFMAVGVLLSVTVTGLQVLVFKYATPPATMTMIWDRVRYLLQQSPHEPRLYQWRDLNTISPHLQRAVLASEDQRFPHHHGFDFIELKIALKEMRTRNRLRGASTITMQAARSLFLVPSRTLWRKAAEAWYTMLMELMWRKERIMEIYLNTVDWGHGLVGAQAAAIRYFHCDARDLTPNQCALLAAILPAPHRWDPVHPSARILARQRRILKYMPRMPVYISEPGWASP